MDEQKDKKVERIFTQAKEVLKHNLKQGKSKMEPVEFYTYICPDRDRYPHQWLWDSCFHCICNSHVDIDLAKAELTTLLKRQEDDGFVPHMSYWEIQKFSMLDKIVQRYYKNKKTSSLTQTPVIPQALETIQKKDKSSTFIKPILSKVARYYDYLYENRCFKDEDQPALLNIIHSWESGVDNSPVYDAALGIKGKFLTLKWMRSLLKQLKVLKQCNWDIENIKKRNFFLYKDLLFNCTYIQGCRIISNLCNENGMKERSSQFSTRAKKMEKALIDNCWNDNSGFFFGLYGDDNAMDSVKSALGFIPLILDGLSPKISHTLVEEHLLEEEEFWAKYPVPSVSLDESSYTEKGLLLWRGPTWININWFIIKGLKKHGFENVAAELSAKTFELVDKFGFREFYSPTTGEGKGAKRFGWSALVIDIKESLIDCTDYDFIFDRDWRHIKKGGFG